MVKKYSREPSNPKQAVKAQVPDLRAHFKNTFESANAIKGMTLVAAQKYLKDVLNRKRCIPFLRYHGGVGRCAQAIEFGKTQGRWPVKSVKVLLGLLDSMEKSAKLKSLEANKLVIRHVQVNRAQKGRRRTYRAHGRINPYLNCNCHIELWAQQIEENVKKGEPKAENKDKKGPKLTKKQQARKRLAIGPN